MINVIIQMVDNVVEDESMDAANGLFGKKNYKPNS